MNKNQHKHLCAAGVACAALLLAALGVGCIGTAAQGAGMLAEIKAYDSQGDYAKAVQASDRLVGMYSKANDEATRLKAAQAHFWRAYSYDLWKDKMSGGGRISPDAAKYREAAIKDYEAAIEKDPGFVEAYFNLALIYYDENDYGKALANFQKVAEISPTTAQAHSYIATIYFQQGRYEDAAAAVSVLLRDSEKAALDQARLLTRQGLTDEAVDMLERAVALNPHFAAGEKELGLLYLFQRKDPERALHHLQNYVKTLPEGEEKKGIDRIIEEIQKCCKP
jgi:tetratricopeptide (TPR) repeat protein